MGTAYAQRLQPLLAARGDEPVGLHPQKAAAASACLPGSCQPTSDLDKTPEATDFIQRPPNCNADLTRMREWSTLVWRWAFREVSLVAGMC